jgi:uncharacterized membrane protein
MPENASRSKSSPSKSSNLFRGTVLRGLGVVLPPLLTIVIFLWIGGTVQNYFFDPLTQMSESLLVASIADVRLPDDIPATQRGKPVVVVGGRLYQRLESGEYIPQSVYEEVVRRPRSEAIPTAGYPMYRTYVRLTYLRPFLMIPTLLVLFILLLYGLGKFMAAGIGRFFWRLFESIIARVPLVRNVYSAVKQVSGFFLNDTEMQVSRVVAVQYPRAGVWAIGFVTGAGIPDLEAIEGEECLSVLVCTSPMPMAGFTINIRRRDVVDLNITLDQAIQFIVSCGVVVPKPRGVADDVPPEEPAEHASDDAASPQPLPTLRSRPTDS